MSEQDFNPDELNRLRDIHTGDEMAAHSQASAVHPFERLSQAFADKNFEIFLNSSPLDSDMDEVDEVTRAEVLDGIETGLEEYRDYLDAHHEGHSIKIGIDKEKVIETRERLIELMKQKGDEAPSAIGLGWRKKLYGQDFQDKLFARGVEIWWPGVTSPVPDLIMDNAVHITVIENPDVTREPLHISLTKEGIASTYVNTYDDNPDTQAWLEVVKSMEPEEWTPLLQLTLSELEAAD